MTYADYLTLGEMLVFLAMGAIWANDHRYARMAKRQADIWRQKWEVADSAAKAHKAESDAHSGDSRRLLAACDRQNHEISQTLGRVLGYPWFKDDPLNFPGATEQHGVQVGDQTADQLAEEAARRIALLRIKAEGADRVPGLTLELEQQRAEVERLKASSPDTNPNTPRRFIWKEGGVDHQGCYFPADHVWTVGGCIVRGLPVTRKLEWIDPQPERAKTSCSAA